jgi:hypothetical protein
MSKVDLKQFKFNEFLTNTLGFLKEHNCPESDPSVWIVWTDKDDAKVQYGPITGRDNFMQQLEEGKSLFFRFSTECFDEEVQCADGNTYECTDANDEEVTSIISERDFLGYSISLANDKFQIELAIHSGEMFPYPEQIIVSDITKYESAMINYLESFIIK